MTNGNEKLQELADEVRQIAEELEHNGETDVLTLQRLENIAFQLEQHARENRIQLSGGHYA